MRSELYNNNETPSWLGHASTRFGKEVKCQRKTGGGAITAPPTNQRSGDPRPIADTLGRCSGAQGLETWGPTSGLLSTRVKTQACGAHKQARHTDIRGWVGDPPDHTMVCGGALARAATGRARNGQAVWYSQTLDKPASSTRRGSDEQAAQATDTTGIINNDGTLSRLRHVDMYRAERLNFAEQELGAATIAPRGGAACKLVQWDLQRACVSSFDLSRVSLQLECESVSEGCYWVPVIASPSRRHFLRPPNHPLQHMPP